MPATSTLQELVIAAHFESPLNLTVIEMANFVATFADDFPAFQQLPAAPRVELAQQTNMPFGQSANVQFAFASPMELPRAVLRSTASQLLIQFQADRFALGWSRSLPLGEPDDYPGYDIMKTEWLAVLEKFHSWHEALMGGIPTVRLIELAYHNATPLGMNGQQRRISEIFRFVQPSRPVNAFQVSWAEALVEEPGSARVSAQVGLGIMPPDQRVLAFNFTGLAPTEGAANSPRSVESIDALHVRILDMHATAIISDEMR